MKRGKHYNYSGRPFIHMAILNHQNTNPESMKEYISFQVRINDRSSLEEMGARVGKALNLKFTPSEADEFEGDEALEAYVLGLWITLNYSSGSQEEVRNYKLTGDVPVDSNDAWMGDINVTSISNFFLGLLKTKDDPGWYIADINELLTEAGLDPDTHSS